MMSMSSLSALLMEKQHAVLLLRQQKTEQSRRDLVNAAVVSNATGTNPWLRLLNQKKQHEQERQAAAAVLAAKNKRRQEEAMLLVQLALQQQQRRKREELLMELSMKSHQSCSVGSNKNSENDTAGGLTLASLAQQQEPQQLFAVGESAPSPSSSLTEALVESLLFGGGGGGQNAEQEAFSARDIQRELPESPSPDVVALSAGAEGCRHALRFLWWC
jgi:hypothetical protein